MIHRAAPAVRASRRACMDAHDYKCITERSPLIALRVVLGREAAWDGDGDGDGEGGEDGKGEGEGGS